MPVTAEVDDLVFGLANLVSRRFQPVEDLSDRGGWLLRRGGQLTASSSAGARIAERLPTRSSDTGRVAPRVGRRWRRPRSSGSRATTRVSCPHRRAQRGGRGGTGFRCALAIASAVRRRIWRVDIAPPAGRRRRPSPRSSSGSASRLRLSAGPGRAAARVTSSSPSSGAPPWFNFARLPVPHEFLQERDQGRGRASKLHQKGHQVLLGELLRLVPLVLDRPSCPAGAAVVLLSQSVPPG